MIRVATSGGFDPFPHMGHRQGFKKMKTMGDRLIVIVNNDDFLIRKRGFVITPLVERIDAIASLKSVDEVVVSTDTDDLVCETLKVIRPDIFAKSGDTWNKGNMPTRMIETCKEIGCNIVFVARQDYPWHSSDIIDTIIRKEKHNGKRSP